MTLVHKFIPTLNYDYIIIGGGIAGTTAAETIRTRDAGASVLIISAEQHRLYSRVILPHVVRGKVAEEKAFLRTADFYKEKNIELRTGIAATGIDTNARVVRLSDESSVVYEKALLIATGGTPRKLTLPGADAADVLYFQTLEDSRRLIDAQNASSAVVYGGGFIGLEFLMSFAKAGIRTTSIVRGNGFFSRVVDARGSEMIGRTLEQNGVILNTGIEIKGIEVSSGKKSVHLSHGGPLVCDVIGAGIGIELYTGFLKESGINSNFGVLADEYLRTSASNVYVAGDVAEIVDPFARVPRTVGNWQNALFQGKIAGANMAGGEEKYEALTSYSISCFGLPIAFAGAVEIVADTRITRLSTSGASLQLIVKGERLVGATCVGPVPERAVVMKLITERVHLTANKLDAAGDSRVDLASLV